MTRRKELYENMTKNINEALDELDEVVRYTHTSDFDEADRHRQNVEDIFPEVVLAYEELTEMVPMKRMTDQEREALVMAEYLQERITKVGSKLARAYKASKA